MQQIGAVGPDGSHAGAAINLRPAVRGIRLDRQFPRPAYVNKQERDDFTEEGANAQAKIARSGPYVGKVRKIKNGRGAGRQSYRGKLISPVNLANLGPVRECLIDEIGGPYAFRDRPPVI